MLKDRRFCCATHRIAASVWVVVAAVLSSKDVGGIRAGSGSPPAGVHAPVGRGGAVPMHQVLSPKVWSETGRLITWLPSCRR